MLKNKVGFPIDELPIFRPDGFPIFKLSPEDVEEVYFFKKMHKELSSD
jgi:hypothetical protein